MKKKIKLSAIIAINIIFVVSCKESIKQPKIKSEQYMDGSFEGESRSVYTSEPFYGEVKITISNNKLIKIIFIIRDSSIHETFDGRYEKHFTGNEIYIEQCRKDWKGVQSYPDSLLKYQDLNKIDAISGATWSYNIFTASAKEALKKATK